MCSERLSILLTGINYEPEPTGVAPYTSGLARGLSSRGHDVRVITAHPHYPQWRIQSSHIGWKSEESLGGVRVQRVLHYVPTRPTGSRRALSEASFGARGIVSRWGSPDVVVSVSPALLSSAAVIARASFSRSRPATGLIVQDLYSVGLAETAPSSGLVQKAITAVEAGVSKSVDGVAVIHDRLKARMISDFDIAEDRVVVVRNWTHVPEVGTFDRDGVRAHLGWKASTVVLHAGAMGEKQDLVNLINSAKAADRRKEDVLFVLLGDGGQRRRLERLAQGIERISFLDPLPGELYGQAMRAADLLLVNERLDVVEMAVPSKLTSYFSTGVPVLAASHESSTTSEEILTSGAGVRIAPGDPEALLETVLRLCSDPVRALEIGARGPNYCASVLSEEAAIDGYEAWMYDLHERAAERRRKR